MLWETDAGDEAARSSSRRRISRTGQRRARRSSTPAIWEIQSLQHRGGRRPGAGAGLRVSSTVFPMLGVARSSDAPSRRKRTRRATTSPSSATRCGAAVRRAPGRHRPDDAAQRPAVRDHRRHAAVVRFVQRRHAVWVPIAFTEQDRERASHSFYAAARLEPGVAFEAARAEIGAIGSRLETGRRQWNRGETRRSRR